MAARHKEPQDKRRILVILRTPEGKEAERLESWRYWEIVGALQWLHVDRETAYHAALWCARTAKPGDTKTLQNGVTMEVRDDT